MRQIILEACCGSADDVVQAAQGGADRVELNADLFQGGLTPSIGTLETIRCHTSIPVMAMLRPRSGGFHYTPLEYESMLNDARELLAHGANGLVFGCLNPDGTVDENRTRRLVELAGEKQSVFHRAFDVTPDWKRALDQLIRLGVTRVLTSGQAQSAVFALDTIAEMIRFAGDEIEILPGAGIRLDNIEQVITKTGTNQVHMSGHQNAEDHSVMNGHADIRFSGTVSPPDNAYKIVDRHYFSLMRNKLNELS